MVTAGYRAVTGGATDDKQMINANTDAAAKPPFTKPAFLFPGQGSQYPGMALDLYERSASVRAVFERASAVFGRDMRQFLSENDEEALKRTDITQQTVTLANLAAAAFLSERGIRAVAAAGHSLGEYAALHEAGVVSLDDCFALVRERGTAMAGTPPDVSGAAMAAVLGLPCRQVSALLEEWAAGGLTGVYAANFNSGKQTVISGTAEALLEAGARFKAAGARRVLPLKVSGPFHSPLMEKAAQTFATFLQTVTFNNPRIPLFSNVTGKQVTTGDEAKTLALRQITSPVRWVDIEAEIGKLAIDAVLEPGPGKVLCGLWADTGSAIPCYPAGNLDALSRIAAA